MGVESRESCSVEQRKFLLIYWMQLALAAGLSRYYHARRNYFSSIELA